MIGKKLTGSSKKPLKFFDVKAKKSFTTDKFTVTKTDNGRKMAKAKAPSGITATRFIK